ncbi:MAG: esterase [Alphaproteobacteria bacterium]|nr:esterase [Alphaproteobacteria bacterium]
MRGEIMAWWRSLALATIGIWAATAQAYDVAEVGSFHVGGREVVLSGLPQQEIVFSAGAPPVKIDPNGEFAVEQMYAQYVKLANPKARFPLLLVHGGGLTGVTYETKPDGKPGWQSFFLNAGHDVYVSDAVERGRASWARYPEIYKTEPVFRPKREAWELFRIGPAGSYAKRETFAGTQFPIEAFDQFAKQGVPRWASNDAATIAAYELYFRKVCPCVVLAHSQGGNLVINAALKVPELIKGLILVEISGAPDPAKADLSGFKTVPHLFLWGDHRQEFPFWVTVTGNIAKYRDGVANAGAAVEWIELPERGVKGNTHMMMMDRNSDQVAQLIQDWFGNHGLMR